MQPAGLQSLHIPPGTEHGKNWDGQGGGMHPAESCSWRSSGQHQHCKPASHRRGDGPTYEGFLPSEASTVLCCMASMAREISCSLCTESWLCQGGEQRVLRASGGDWLFSAPSLSLLTPQNLTLTDNFVSDLTRVNMRELVEVISPRDTRLHLHPARNLSKNAPLII